jgi:hypothetical protein
MLTTPLQVSILLAHKRGEESHYTFNSLKQREILFKKREQSFAEEISAFYYMNLNSNIRWGIDILQNYPLSSESSKLLNRTPRECLSLIFKYDRRKPPLKIWFSKWMNDLTSLYQEILQNIKGRYSF